METSTIVFIVLGMIGASVVIFFLLKLKERQDRLKELISQKFAGKKKILHDPHALLIAQESRGLSQRRGNGHLILTEKVLFFGMPLPWVVYEIPVPSIGEMERVRRMGGKSTLKQLLKIHYQDAKGKSDALGIYLKDMDRWEEEISRLKRS